MPTPEHQFTSSGVAADTFGVIHFSGTEAISQPYRFEVELVTPDPNVALEDIVDASATLTIAPPHGASFGRSPEPVDIHGIVVEIEAAGTASTDADLLYVYRAVLVPSLWRLSLSWQSRIFQNLSVEEIVGKVLDDAGVKHKFKLEESLGPREYTTQYKETDLAFVQRLLEFEGIRYHFEQDDGGEVLVISDGYDAPTIAGDEPLVEFFRAGGLLVDEGVETVSAFSARQRLVTGAAEHVDYNYRTPATTLQANETIDGAPAAGVESDSMAHTETPSRTDRITHVRAQAIETTRRVMTGASDRRSFRAGHNFLLENHDRDALNQAYLITHVEHVGAVAQASGLADGDDRPVYANTFTCVPASVAYRPPRLTPEPRLPGVLTARVESTGGEYAPIDDQGRYRVRFPFDIGDAGSAQATKPVRLAQPYSGPEYGQHFPVHKDAEMVVACVDGNVDRIIGLATVPNPIQASPVTSANQTENTIRTAASNHIVLQDLKGNVGIDIMTPTATSRIHLGAAEKAVAGIQYSTTGLQTIQAGGGIFLKAGATADTLGAVMGSDDLNQLMNDLTTADATVGAVISVASALISGAPRDLFTKSFAMGALNTAAGWYAGHGEGTGWPGTYLASDGGVFASTPAGISAYAGAGGIGLTTATGIDLTAATLGINLAVGSGGITLGAAKGGIVTAALLDDIHTHAKTGNIKTEARDNILFTSHKKNFHVQAPDASGNVSLYAGQHVELEAKKDGISTYGEHLKVKVGKTATFSVEDKIVFECGQSKITLEKNGTITVKAGQNTFKMSASGIEMKATTSVKVEGKTGVDVKGLNVKLKGDLQAALEGVMVDVKASGIASVKGALTKIG